MFSRKLDPTIAQQLAVIVWLLASESTCGQALETPVVDCVRTALDVGSNAVGFESLSTCDLRLVIKCLAL